MISEVGYDIEPLKKISRFKNVILSSLAPHNKCVVSISPLMAHNTDSSCRNECSDISKIQGWISDRWGCRTRSTNTEP